MVKQQTVKKVWIATAVITGLFLFEAACAWSFNWDDQPKLGGSIKFNPYTYLPQRGRPMSRVDVEEMKKRRKNPLASVAPQAPAVVKDADGNVLYYHDGKLRVKVSPEGTMTFYSEGTAVYEKDYDGELLKKFEHLGDGLIEVRNEWGEIVGFRQFGARNRLLQEKDSDGNLVATYEYGSPLHTVIDELTGRKTFYDYGKLVREEDFEGNILATYHYQGRNLWMKIEKTTDAEGNVIDGNKTIYDEKGRRPLRVVDPRGWEVTTYHYDENGRLASVVDHENGTVTEYERNRPVVVKDLEGHTRKTYEWKGTKLLWTIDVETKEVTWYDDGRETKTTSDGEPVKQWIRADGKLLGIADLRSNTLTLFDHGRVSQVLYFPDSLSAEQAEEWIQENWIG